MQSMALNLFNKPLSCFFSSFISLLVIMMMALVIMPSPVRAAESNVEGLKVLRPDSIGAVKRVSLGLDKSLVVELPRDVRDVLVANPEIADAIVRTARKIFLIGNRVGQTNIFMFDSAGNTVLSLDLKVERDILPLAELIEKYVDGADVKVEIANDNVILTGTVPNPLAARRAADLAQAFVTGGEATTGQFTQTATGTNGDAAISNPDEGQRQVSQVINLLRIEGEDQVHLKVVIAEIRRSVLKQLGVDLSVLQAGGTTAFSVARDALFGAAGFAQPGGVAASVASVQGQTTLTATIRALERANVLRTLAEPTLTAQSGREASFLAGGEINVPTGSTVDDDGDVTVEFERTTLGVSLSFTPIVQSAERISITLNTEVSDIDTTRSLAFSAGPVAIPAISVRRASSTIELPSGGTMIVGGLLRDDIRQASSGVPYFKNLPILGPLFGSNNFIRNETELIIMVTPYLVRPTARKNLTRPDKNYALNNDAGNFFFNRLNRIYGGNKQNAPGKYHGRVGFIYD